MMLAIQSRSWSARARYRRTGGFTLIELIVATAIMVILVSMAVPVTSFAIKREKERELRYDLWMMRDAIDRYKDAADRAAFQIKLGSEGYPPDLETLVNGVDTNGKKLKFLRRIPVDPMTGKPEWGMHSMQDDPTSDSWGGESVFDVYREHPGLGRAERLFRPLAAQLRSQQAAIDECVQWRLPLTRWTNRGPGASRR